MEDELKDEVLGNNNMQANDAVVVSEESVELNNPHDVAFDEVNLQQSATYSIEQPRFDWNWGAFSFPFIWGLANGCIWQAVLALIPYFNLIWRFVMGAKANTWAWKELGFGYHDVEKFNKVQKGWSIAGLVFLCVIGVVLLIALCFS